jgi:hypothetical protein
MAKDFREYLVEASRSDQFGRVFKELAVGFKVFVSFQASDVHSSTPEETLDDIYEYTHWEVALRSTTPPIDTPSIGPWMSFRDKEWAEPFDRPEFQRAMVGEFIPTEHCQQILEDCIAYAIEKGHIESEDEIRTVEPDEEVKKTMGCGGCGGKKKPARKDAAKPAE